MNRPKPLWAATVFSWELYIDGGKVDHFGRMSISQSVSGYGTSGVVTATMTFMTDSIHASASENAEVKLICTNAAAISPPLFYVTGRKTSGSVTEWTCCDIVSKTDRLIEFTDSDFDANDKITISALLTKIHDQSGIGINASGLSALINKTFDKEKCVDGLTIRAVFETLAEAMCGYWVGVGNEIKFINFGQSVFSAVPTAYKAIDFNGVRSFARVLCTDNEAVYSADSSGSGKMLIVSTDYASQELANSILSMMVGSANNYTYQSWSCGKGKADEWLYVGQFRFGQQFLVANSVSMSVSSSGLFFSASANTVDEDEVGYTSEVSRQLKKKLEFDKINGNVAITGKGLYLFENGYKAKTPEEQKKAKYDFKVEKGGVTKYGGAMVDTKLPEITFKSDASGFTTKYGDTSIEYEMSIDGDNLTLNEKEGE